MTIQTGLDTASFELGESVAVNGVCLTVAAFGPARFEADASPETLKRSNLGRFKPGEPLNLERALRPVDRLGGHFVLGHVDGTGRVASVGTEGEFRVYRFDAGPSVTRYLVEKGSVAVDGISLTVNGCDDRSFSVAIIPHTLARTTLVRRTPGESVNLEVDILAKYVEKLLGGRPASGGLTLDQLARSGFLK